MIPVAADPNWFYSTIAQSTAALVGLAGAFLLQRLLSQREEVGLMRQNLRDRSLALRESIHGQSEVVKDLLDGLETALDEARDQPDDSDFISAEATIYLLGPEGGASGEVAGLSEFPRDAGLSMLQDALVSLKSFAGALDTVTFERLVEDIRLLGRIGPPDPAWIQEGKPVTGPQISNPRQTLWARMEVQHQWVTLLWRQFVQKSEAINRDLIRLRLRLAPPTFYFLFLVLLLMLAAGVLAPLVFLSAESGPSKWILFGLFTPLSAAFVGFFGWELRNLRRADRLLKETF